MSCLAKPQVRHPPGLVALLQASGIGDLSLEWPLRKLRCSWRTTGSTLYSGKPQGPQQTGLHGVTVGW